jgi:hypothetical protein
LEERLRAQAMDLAMDISGQIKDGRRKVKIQVNLEITVDNSTADDQPAAPPAPRRSSGSRPSRAKKPEQTPAAPEAPPAPEDD